MWVLSYWIYYFMLKGKSLPDYTNLFSPNYYEKNDKMMKHQLKEETSIEILKIIGLIENI